MRDFLAMNYQTFCCSVAVLGAAWLAVDCMRDLLRALRRTR